MNVRRILLQCEADGAVREQEHAAELKAEGKLRWTADDPDCPDVMRLAALVEETGEVARCLHDNDRESLTLELRQLAGIAIAWATVADSAPAEDGGSHRKEAESSAS